MRIGAHVSVAGGLLNAVANAREAGCEAFQVFVSNARGWAPPVPDAAAELLFRRLVVEDGLGPVFVHAGSDLGAGRAEGLRRSREAILPLLDEGDGPDLLLELTAGTRNAVASRFEEMAELLDVLGWHPRLKVCFDTCHAHAAGYDLSTIAGATAAVTGLLAAVGDRVSLVHANDSAEPAGQARDVARLRKLREAGLSHAGRR